MLDYVLGLIFLASWLILLLIPFFYYLYKKNWPNFWLTLFVICFGAFNLGLTPVLNDLEPGIQKLFWQIAWAVSDAAMIIAIRMLFEKKGWKSEEAFRVCVFSSIAIVLYFIRHIENTVEMYALYYVLPATLNAINMMIFLTLCTDIFKTIWTFLKSTIRSIKQKRKLAVQFKTKGN